MDKKDENYKIIITLRDDKSWDYKVGFWPTGIGLDGTAKDLKTALERVAEYQRGKLPYKWQKTAYDLHL